jgi:hypothetical protein
LIPERRRDQRAATDEDRIGRADDEVPAAPRPVGASADLPVVHHLEARDIDCDVTAVSISPGQRASYCKVVNGEVAGMDLDSSGIAEYAGGVVAWRGSGWVPRPGHQE